MLFFNYFFQISRTNIHNLMLSIDSFRIRERRFPNSAFGFHPINTPKNELCTCNIENTCPPGRQGKRGPPGTDGVDGVFKLGVGPRSVGVEKLGVGVRVMIEGLAKKVRGRGPTLH